MQSMIALYLAGVVAGLSVVGCFNRSIRQVLTEFFGTIQNAAEGAAEWFRTQRASLRDWINSLFTSEGAITTGERLTYFIGAVFNTCFFAVFLAADYSLTVLTLAAIGLTEGPAPQLPWRIDLVTGVSVLLPAIFLGLVLMDLAGMTRLAPWQRLSRPLRIGAACVSLLAFALSVVLMVSLGLFRAAALQEAGAEPARIQVQGQEPAAVGDGKSLALAMVGDSAAMPSSDTAESDPNASILTESMAKVREYIPWLVMAGIPALLTLSALMSGIGPLMLLIYVAIGGVGVLCVGSWLAEVAFLLVRAAAITVWATLEAAFSFVARIGIALVRPGVNLARNFVRNTSWQDANGFTRVALAFASVVDDLEVPEEGVGTMTRLPQPGLTAEAQPGDAPPEEPATDANPDGPAPRKQYVHEDSSQAPGPGNGNGAHPW